MATAKNTLCLGAIEGMKMTASVPIVPRPIDNAARLVEHGDVADLLAQERAYAIRLWTVLNEMRLHGELPDWVARSFPGVGTRAEATARSALAGRVDLAIAANRRTEETVDNDYATVALLDSN